MGSFGVWPVNRGSLGCGLFLGVAWGVRLFLGVTWDVAFFLVGGIALGWDLFLTRVELAEG